MEKLNASEYLLPKCIDINWTHSVYKGLIIGVVYLLDFLTNYALTIFWQKRRKSLLINVLSFMFYLPQWVTVVFSKFRFLIVVLIKCSLTWREVVLRPSPSTKAGDLPKNNLRWPECQPNNHLLLQLSISSYKNQIQLSSALPHWQGTESYVRRKAPQEKSKTSCLIVMVSLQARGDFKNSASLLTLVRTNWIDNSAFEGSNELLWQMFGWFPCVFWWGIVLPLNKVPCLAYDKPLGDCTLNFVNTHHSRLGTIFFKISSQSYSLKTVALFAIIT